MTEVGEMDDLRKLLTDRRTLRAAVGMWRSIAEGNEAEARRLRKAIAMHKRRVVIDPQPWDRDLWAVLDA